MHDRSVEPDLSFGQLKNIYSDREELDRFDDAPPVHF
jgi:hypothetical protein